MGEDARPRVPRQPAPDPPCIPAKTRPLAAGATIAAGLPLWAGPLNYVVMPLHLGTGIASGCPFSANMQLRTFAGSDALAFLA